jgi:hypothetical protein
LSFFGEIRLRRENAAKLEALAAALDGGPEEEMPIGAVLRRGGNRLTAFSAPGS